MASKITQRSGRSRARTPGAALALALVLLFALAGPALEATGAQRYLTHRAGTPEHYWSREPAAGERQPLVRLAVVGDVGTGSEAAYRTAGAITEAGRVRPFDGLILLGDNVYPDGNPRRLPYAVFWPFRPLLDAGTRLLPVLGNHDVQAGYGEAQLRALGMPGRWYAVRLGELLVVALDSNRPDDRSQLAWIERILERSDARWTIAILHHPPYSAGWHGSDERAREAFAPLFERYGVQLVLAGHDHDYQRSRPLEGVTYVVSGAAAKTRPTSHAPFTDAAWSALHYLEIDVWADRIELRAVSQDGLVFDEATIEAAHLAPTVSTGSPRHTR